MNQNDSQLIAHHIVDARGLKCPMPVIKLQQQVRQSLPGELISIECTDPGAEKDISSWTRVNKHTLVHVITTDDGCRIFIKIKPKA
ncbi:sulfurtransferase TusA family protein [Thiomicrorhabdus arctica]|uniref:sulfurtransferase TusA family protein n=1 Tax=Thiomicrorhabdus arctica TaxID=131540 RepID=UPI00037C878A|nr:sulfurtransferase TusA family protein [Thiomicrorhabdus arctica]